MIFSAINAGDILIAILLLVISYLIGSIPFGIVIGRSIKKTDIREHGSKNIGSTNAIRILGKKVGALVFLLDVFKGMLIILLIRYVLEPLNIWTSPINYVFYGFAAILGHVFSCYLGFKGGKAVATSLGVVLALTPLAGVLCLVSFALVTLLLGYVSLASTAAMLTVMITTWVLYGVGMNPAVNFFLGKPDLITCIVYSFMGVIILLKHVKNYKRLINGTENCFKKKKQKQD